MTTHLKSSTTETSARRRILAIDDDPQIRSLLVAFLRRDYVVALANDGSEGFQKATEFPPDIAIIDIQMPGWDGLQTLENFRSDPRLKDVRIIMLTGDASRQTVMAAISLGADDYIVKSSLSRHDLHRKIERVMSRPKTSTPSPVCAVPPRDLDRKVQMAPPQPGRAVIPTVTPAFAASVNSDARSTEAGMLNQQPASIATIDAPVAAATAPVVDARLQEMLDAWE